MQNALIETEADQQEKQGPNSLEMKTYEYKVHTLETGQTADQKHRNKC